MEGRRHGVATVPYTRDFPPRLAQAGVVHRHHQRRFARQHMQDAAYDGRKEVVHVPLVACEQAVVCRPIVALSSTCADEARNGVSTQAGELAKAKSLGSFPSSMLAERVHALRPNRLDFGQKL